MLCWENGFCVNYWAAPPWVKMATINGTNFYQALSWISPQTHSLSGHCTFYHNYCHCHNNIIVLSSCQTYRPHAYLSLIILFLSAVIGIAIIIIVILHHRNCHHNNNTFPTSILQIIFLLHPLHPPRSAWRAVFEVLAPLAATAVKIIAPLAAWTNNEYEKTMMMMIT